MVQFLVKKLSIGVIFICFTLLISGCSPGLLRSHTGYVPENALRLAQVIQIIDRAVLLHDKSKETYEAIIASGIKDSDITDGSFVAARVYCCGGITIELSSEVANSLVVFVPKSLNVSLGDIIEIKSGRSPEKGDAGQVNTMTRVVQKYKEIDYNKCWWDPKNDRLWLRVLYCDWMPGDGWIKQTGTYPAWYKPAAASPSIK